MLAAALKGGVNRFAESIPQFLFLAAFQRDALGFLLPAVLQFLDGVDAQFATAQGLSLFDQLLAYGQAGLLHGLQRLGGLLQGSFPLGLQFGKNFFADVAGFAPAAAEFAQFAVHGLPVDRVRGLRAAGNQCLAPGFDFMQQRQSQAFLLGGLLLHVRQPGLNDAVGFVTGLVESTPKGMIGHAALIDFFPLLAQLAQHVLQFAWAVWAGRQLGFAAFSLRSIRFCRGSF